MAHDGTKYFRDHFVERFACFRYRVFDLEIAEKTFTHYHVKHA